MLRDRPDINAVGEGYNTALFEAALHNHKEAVKILSGSGAHVFAPSNPPYAETPIHTAARGSSGELLKILLQAEGNDQCLERKNTWGETPILLALNRSDMNCFELLFQHGASIHAVQRDGWSVLHKLADRGLYDALKHHINDFTPNEFEARTSGGLTPLDLAKEVGRIEVVRLLKSHIRGSIDGKSSTMNMIKQKLGFT